MDTDLATKTRPLLDRPARRRVLVLLCVEAVIISGLAVWLARGLLAG